MDARFTLLLVCFFLSGFAALLYQTAWTRELAFVFGTSELAVAAVLAAYMGGLALGAAAAARFARRMRRPVLVYGVLEGLIAISALSVPLGIRLVNAVYVGLLGGGGELPDDGATVATLFQVAAAFAVLLPPTAFMGATLPLLARHAVRSEAEIGSRVGLLYAVNTAGAIAGTLIAAFWWMPELGLRRTVWAGAGINALVFALAAMLARKAAAPSAPVADERPTADAVGEAWILPAMLFSGAVSFAYEVLWTRLLGQVLGGSLDAFATMLASFLLGIALGSAVAARVATTRARAALGFAVAQLGIALTSYGAFAFADRLPELSLRLGAGPGAPLASAALAAATLLPITLCIGATFPFAVRLRARTPEDAAGATARVYAWNTVGAIAGSLGAGFVLLPELGFEGVIFLGAAVNLGLAAVAALVVRPQRIAVAALVAAALFALLVLPPRTPWALLSSSPLTRKPARGDVVYAAVGRSATVMLFDRGSDFLLNSNGLPESKIERTGMLPRANLARWLGLLPTLLRPEAREVLMVGLGGGVALEPIAPTVGRIDVIELEQEVWAANQRVAAERAIDPLARPELRVHIADARGALQLSAKRYDAIVSQPSHPWTAGASHLYTREFFEMVRARLAPGGVFVQWIGLKFVDETLLRSLAATLAAVFPHVEVYQPGAVRGVLLAASESPLSSLEAAGRALRQAPEHYARFGIHRVEDLAVARVLDDEGTRAFAAGGLQNTDDHNRLASRASRLGAGALDESSVGALFESHDPLLARSPGLDRSVLVRGLVAANAHERATHLSLAAGGAAEEAGLGWVELGRGRAGRALRHFVRALALAPGDRDAIDGLVATRAFDLAAGRAVGGVSEADLDASLRAVIQARRLAANADWAGVAAQEALLARFAPGDALFEESSRLRIQWRLALGDPKDAATAQDLAETLLVRRWTLADALLRARSALAADRPRAAWGSLDRMLARAGSSESAAAMTGMALGLAESLPAPLAEDLRTRFAPARRRPDRPKSPPE